MATQYVPQQPLQSQPQSDRKVIAVAKSGIKVVATGGNLSRQPPNAPRRGIGLKKPGDDTWGGIETLDFASVKNDLGADRNLFVPRLGMPPRELEPGMAKHARQGDLTQFFRYGEIIAADWIIGDDFNWQLNPFNGVINLGSQTPHGGSAIRYEFETQNLDGFDPPRYQKRIENLYYIRLLPLELPSYHFWVRPGEAPPPEDKVHHSRYKRLVAGSYITEHSQIYPISNTHRMLTPDLTDADINHGRGYPSSWDNPQNQPIGFPHTFQPAVNFGQQRFGATQPAYPGLQSYTGLPYQNQFVGSPPPPGPKSRRILSPPNSASMSYSPLRSGPKSSQSRSNTSATGNDLDSVTFVRWKQETKLGKNDPSPVPTFLISKPSPPEFIEVPLGRDVNTLISRVKHLYPLTRATWSFRLHPNIDSWDYQGDWGMISAIDTPSQRKSVFERLSKSFSPMDPAVVTYCPGPIVVKQWCDTSYGCEEEVWDWYTEKTAQGNARRFHARDDLADICVRLLNIDPRSDQPGVIIVTRTPGQPDRVARWWPNMSMLDWQKWVYYPIDQEEICIAPGLSEPSGNFEDDFDRAIEEAKVEKRFHELVRF